MTLTPFKLRTEILLNTVKSLLVFIRWTSNLVFFLWEGQPYKLFLHLSYIAFHLKSTSSSVNKHVHRHQTAKFQAHEIK